MDNNNLYGSDNNTSGTNGATGNPYESAPQQDNNNTYVKPEGGMNNGGYQQPYGSQPYNNQQPYSTQQPYNGQQQYQTYNQPNNYYSAAEEPQKASGLAIASMVCGILSIVLCCVWYLSAILAIAAIVMGIINNVKKMGGKGMAIAGIVTGACGLLLAIAWIIIIFAGVYSGEFADLMY